MYKAIAVLVSMLFVFSLAGATPAVEKGNKIKMAIGVMKALDAKANALTITDNKNTDFTCFFDDRTVMRANTGKQITTADIKVGDMIVLLYNEVDGKNIAKNITAVSKVPLSSPDKKN